MKKDLHTIYIVEDALRVVREEAGRWKVRSDKEASGSLVGIQQKGFSLVLYALRTGPNADQSTGHVVTDHIYQNACLAAIAQFARRQTWNMAPVYLSDWHSHPMWLPSLSGTDKDTCADILHDGDYSYLNGLPLILVTFRGESKPHFVPMWIVLADGSLRINRAEMIAVAQDDDRLMALLKGNDYTPIEDIPGIPEYRSRADQVCRAEKEAADGSRKDLLVRVDEEVRNITARFHVPHSVLYTPSRLLCIHTKIDKNTFALVLPPEFPLNPPMVFVKKTTDHAYREHASRLPWNSCARLVDVIEEIVTNAKGMKGGPDDRRKGRSKKRA